MKYIIKLLDSITRCYVPKLSKNYEESPVHLEFESRNKSLDKNFKLLVQCLGDLTLTNTKEASKIIAYLFILHKELKSNLPWNDKKCKECAVKLNQYFEVLGDVPLDNILQVKSKFNTQDIFDKCLDILHSKLTSEDFKKYPSYIEVYCSLIADLKKYNVVVIPQKIFPVPLLLIDDFMYSNKKRGLSCCLPALQCLEQKDFDGGNYYEVVYRSLKRTFFEKDVRITVFTHASLLELCKIFPPDVKNSKLDDMYSVILDQIIGESNIYRKAECLKFAKQIIKMHKVNCVSKSSFKTVICDSLDLCTIDVVADMVLMETLECLEEWMTHCWCIWKLSTDHKIISMLLKVLYTCKSEKHALYIQKLTIVLIGLCKADEQKHILSNLNKANTIGNDVFQKRVDEIKLNIKNFINSRQ